MIIFWITLDRIHFAINHRDSKHYSCYLESFFLARSDLCHRRCFKKERNRVFHITVFFYHQMFTTDVNYTQSLTGLILQDLQDGALTEIFAFSSSFYENISSFALLVVIYRIIKFRSSRKVKCSYLCLYLLRSRFTVK